MLISLGSWGLAQWQSSRIRARGETLERLDLEIEKRLSEALQSLSAQYEREQRSAAGRIAGLSGQVTTLREQVEQLEGHVNDLATDYSQLAKDYRRIANALDRLSRR